jgi:hypothetical protein
MAEQKPIQMDPMRRAAAANACPSSLQSVEAQTQHLAKRHLVFIDYIDERSLVSRVALMLICSF